MIVSILALDLVHRGLRQNNILAVELGDRLADLARELGLKIGCERHIDGEISLRSKLVMLTVTE